MTSSPSGSAFPVSSFVRIADGIEGLVHLRELAWTAVESPEEVVAVGDEISVVATEIDRVRRRVALSRRQGFPARMTRGHPGRAPQLITTERPSASRRCVVRVLDGVGEPGEHAAVA